MVKELANCSVAVVKAYLSHFNPKSGALFQKPLTGAKLKPSSDVILFSTLPFGHNTIDSMIKNMCLRVGIDPPFTNHSVKSTTVKILSPKDIKNRHITVVTGHKSDASLESYNDRLTFEQFKNLSSAITDFINFCRLDPKDAINPLAEMNRSPLETISKAIHSSTLANVQESIRVQEKCLLTLHMASSLVAPSPTALSVSTLKKKPADGPETTDKFNKTKQDLVAIISGGAEVTRGLKENITLNASLSYDPNATHGKRQGMNFTWHYGKITADHSSKQVDWKTKKGFSAAVNESAINYYGKGSGETISLNTEALSLNQTYIVKLEVTKDIRISSVYQVVHLLEGDPPKIYQRTKEDVWGMSAYDISTALPPTGGKCLITPPSGTSLKTDFNLSCSNWKSNSSPLSYEFQYRLQNGLSSVLYRGANNTISASRIPPGNKADNFTVKFNVTVTDSLGISASPFPLTVQIKPFFNITNLLMANDSSFTELIQGGNLREAALLANTVLQSVLQENSTDLQKRYTVMHNILVKISSLERKSVADLLQSSSVIGSALLVLDKVNHEALLLKLISIPQNISLLANISLSAVRSMTSLLWSLARKRDIADIQLTSQSAENLALCLNSVLKAAAVMASEDSESSFQEQGKMLAKIAMKVLEKVSDSVLALTVPDEKAISITAGQLSMTLGRYSLQRLSGLEIKAGKGRFMLPSETEFIVSGVNKTSFVDAQVLAASDGFISCSCNYLTSFGGSILVEPNPIDFDKVLVEFQQLPETGNIAVIVAMAVVLLCYASALVIVRKFDKEDAKNKESPIHLPSSPNSTYEYEVVITTGAWKNSGTTAHVALEIYGSDGKSGVLHLRQEEPGAVNMLFSRGNSDVFVLYVNKSLGWIRGLQIGHDNFGNNPSWFHEEILIRDLHTNQSWKFMANLWFALERGDGRIERTICQSHLDFSREVARRWRRGLVESHIWISVAAKLRRSHFTRVQRLSCCLSVLLTSMFANAMFYKLEGNYQQPIQVGPLKMSWRQVVTGFESALVVAPINIIIALFFQKGAEKYEKNNGYCHKGTLITGIAWFLLLCSCTVSAAFSIFYSLIWENSVSEQWLSSMLISFAQDITIKEPVKVFFTALTIAAILRVKVKRSKVHASESPQEVKTEYSKQKFWALQLSDVEKMRRRQAKKQNLTRYFTELVAYLVFVFFLMVMCYGNRNDHRYMMTKSIRDGLPSFSRVKNNTLYWNWLQKVYIPGVFSGRWYNGQEEMETMYIAHCKVPNYIEECFEGYSIENEDKTAYNKPGWRPVENVTRNDKLLRLCPRPWRYQHVDDTDTIPRWGQFSYYHGGGFVADLGYQNHTGFSIVTDLQKNSWLDKKTRVVIAEFSTFNPSLNVLVVAIQKGYRHGTDFFLKEEEWQASINISAKDFAENGSVVVGCVYKDLHELLLRNKSIRKETDGPRYVNTKIVTAAMNPKPEQLRQDVILRFKNLEVVDKIKHCVFWSGFKISPDGFSEKGCYVDPSNSNSEETVCSCSHLTHFAVLVDFSGGTKLSTKDITILEIITYVGLSLSIIGMLWTITLYFFLTDVRQPLSQIRLSLAVALGAGQIIFLTGINATENKAVCVTVAALMQYFLMAAFCWMLVEGIYLYLFVVKVYNINTKMHMYHVMSWGLPLVMVAISLCIAAGKEGIKSYTSDKLCWMSSENNLIWIFVTFVITIEVGFLIFVLHCLRNSQIRERFKRKVNTIVPSTNSGNSTKKSSQINPSDVGDMWVAELQSCNEFELNEKPST
ncbi:Polycystic kidney disease protein 1-like 2 [Stylophora pistillata]|uniref:Polycystic kidney disease protein 1-like 2 n=1 Tax=Stylophora pistillata TaxID=50429 RepID=A0A2B4RBU6_STYPI|nr:Polycystic kidney disease protein 1-like 2 [Stylophora pistillata]